jgi:hypothetical protein
MYFQIDLKARQAALGLGTPGPWFTVWIGYATTYQWNYTWVPNPTLIYKIDHFTDNPPNWRVYTTPPFNPTLHRAYCLPWSELEGPDLTKGWQYCSGVSGYITVSKVTLTSPKHLIIFPALKISGRDEGIGDCRQILIL